MTRAKRQMIEDIKLIDLVIEILDARIPLSSRNPDIDTIAGNKSRLILLNKSDMADPACTTEWIQFFEKAGITALEINALQSADMKDINASVQKVCQEKILRDQKRGIRNRPVRAMVAGIPNVGKSTFINTFSRKGAAKTGNKPGVTKGKQWVRLSNTLELLDTPGLLWPKFEDPETGIKLALTGSIRDEILNVEELSLELIKRLEMSYPGVLGAYYGIVPDAKDEPAAVLDKIAIKRGCIGKGEQIDYLRAASMILENFRNGKIGRITLEKPEEY